MFYLHNAIYSGQSTVNFVAWSLEVEVQFYIIAPLLARMFSIGDVRLRRSAIAGTALLAAVLQSLANLPDYSVGLSLASQIQYFLMGFLLVDIYLVTWKRKPAHDSRWDIIAIISSCLLLVVLFFNVAINFTTPALIFVMYLGAFRGRLVNSLVRHRWIVVIGGMCYTIYLYHVVVMETVYSRLMYRFHLSHAYPANILLQAVLLSPFILITCSFLFVYLEKPFMQRNWPSKWAAVLRRDQTKASPQ